jgi:hypothetical protein
MAVVLSSEFLTNRADAMLVVFTASLIAHWANAVMPVISAKLVSIGHASILSSAGPFLTDWTRTLVSNDLAIATCKGAD